MSTTAVTVSPEGEVKVSDADLSLGFLQGEVEGLIAPVPNMTGIDAVAYVNDEGLLIGMERNPVAEQLFGYAPLVGPCVVIGPLDEEGDSTPITEEVLAIFLRGAFAGAQG